MTLQEIKHDFMAFRNGIIADTLRKAGQPYSVIFGLQLPQLGEIARKAGKDRHLAEQLWADRNVRESRLLAPYLFEATDLTVDDAYRMLADSRTREEIDILVFRLLRYHPEQSAIRERLDKAIDDGINPEMGRYAKEALDRFRD